MLKVGIVGLGLIGKVHFRAFQKFKNAKIVAVCDACESFFVGSKSPGNSWNAPGDALDLTGIKCYSNLADMLRCVELDAVILCVPTDLHSEFAINALKAGVHVLCEKPMALTVPQCEEMIKIAGKSGKILQIGHCIRFWPEYAKAKEIVDSNQYGRIKVAAFQRFSAFPVHWMLDGKKSGGAILDLHIHDTDYIQYLLGIPYSVQTHGIIGPSGDYDHVVTNYRYGTEMVVTAEGGWMMPKGFGFEMSFKIILEKAALVYDLTRKPSLWVYPETEDPFVPEIQAGDGYSCEIGYFLKLVAGEKIKSVITPEESLHAVKTVLLEKESVKLEREMVVK